MKNDGVSTARHFIDSGGLQFGILSSDTRDCRHATGD